MSEFFAMGGYAAYVWPSYGVSIFVGLVMGLHSLRRYRRARQLVTRLEKQRAKQTGTPAA